MDTLFPTGKSTDLIPIEKGFGIKKIGDDRIEFYHFDKLLKAVPRKHKLNFGFLSLILGSVMR